MDTSTFGAGGEVALFPGTIRLARLFGYTEDGELCSPFLDDKSIFYRDHVIDTGYRWWSRNRFIPVAEKGNVEKSPDHWHLSHCPTYRGCEPGRPERSCHCGYYTFFSRPMSYLAPGVGTVGHIDGIIEGKGRVVVDTKGARVGQMKIVALVMPQKSSFWKMARSDMWDWFRRLMHFEPRAMLGLVWAMWVGFWLSNAIWFSKPDWVRTLTIIIWSVAIVGFVAIRIFLTKLKIPVKMDLNIRAQIMAEHPHIKVYDTWGEMVKNHPLSDPKSFQNE